MPDNNATAPARDAALKYLGYRMRTRREMERYLAKKGYTEAAIIDAIGMLERNRYIDDLVFAKQFIESSLRFNKWGMKKIRYELALKGVAPDIIDEAVETADNPAGEIILRLVEKRINCPVAELDAAEKRKLYAYLMNRGFSYDEIYAALT